MSNKARLQGIATEKVVKSFRIIRFVSATTLIVDARQSSRHAYSIVEVTSGYCFEAETQPLLDVVRPLSQTTLALELDSETV